MLSIVGEKATPGSLPAGLPRARSRQADLAAVLASTSRKLLRGDFGISFSTSRPVLTDLLAFFPATLELATIGLIIGVVLGVPMGVASAYWHEKWPDHLIRIVGLIGYSVPIFWLGLVGLFVFYYLLDWVAGPGQVDVFYIGVVDARHRLDPDRRRHAGASGRSSATPSAT